MSDPVAQNIDELYKVEEYVEQACKSLLNGAGITNVYTQRESVSVQNPRVDVQMAIGNYQANPLIDKSGAWRVAIWNGVVGLRIVTKRSKDTEPAYNSEHAGIKAKVRRIMSERDASGKPVNFDTSVLPYHCILKLVDANAQLSDESEDDQDISFLHYNVVVQIRTTAWPIS